MTLSNNNAAVQLIKAALAENKVVAVSYEEDSFEDHVYQGLDHSKIIEEMTACDSAMIFIQTGETNTGWETAYIINEGCVDAEETVSDYVVGGWIERFEMARGN